MKDVITGNIFN